MIYLTEIIFTLMHAQRCVLPVFCPSESTGRKTGKSHLCALCIILFDFIMEETLKLKNLGNRSMVPI